MIQSLSRRRAFTLVELLVVIAIIALLASIILPSMRSVESQARAAKCKANLHNISAAWSSLNIDQIRLNQYVWTMQLITSLNEVTETFICPEDDDPFLAGLDAIKIRVWSGTNVVCDMDIFENLGSYGHGDATQNYTWRVNEEEYTRLKGQYESSSNRNNFYNNFTDYTPGQNSNVSYLLMEDLRTSASPDWDFWDFTVRLEEKPNGTYDVTATKGYAGYNFGVVGADGAPPDGPTMTGTGNSTRLSVQALPCSYGANNYLTRFLQGESTIMMLDYSKAVANCVGNDATPAEFGTKVRPRHRGKINVLYGDGSVRLLAPAAIDPNEPGNGKQWMPQGLGTGK